MEVVFTFLVGDIEYGPKERTSGSDVIDAAQTWVRCKELLQETTSLTKVITVYVEDGDYRYKVVVTAENVRTYKGNWTCRLLK